MSDGDDQEGTDSDQEIEDDDENLLSDDLVEFEGEYVSGAGLSAEEEAVVQRFLQAGKSETRSLADIIMEKIKEKEDTDDFDAVESVDESHSSPRIPPKVLEVYTSVGKMLAHYKAGKLPKALKMLPHLKNWEEVLWITRPDEWSPSATYACTRIFASNLNEKMAQRYILEMSFISSSKSSMVYHLVFLSFTCLTSALNAIINNAITQVLQHGTPGEVP